MHDFKLPEAVADIIKAANLIIGATTLIWKIYCRLRPARCNPPAPPPGDGPGSSPPAIWFN